MNHNLTHSPSAALRSPSWISALLFLALLGVPGDRELAFSHEDDLKGRNAPPPYTGPGYRRGAGGPQTFGPVGGIGDGVQLLSWVTLPEMQPGIANGNDCWGYTSPTGREYALMAHSSGTTVIEISNPGNPQILTTIDGPNALHRDVKTYDSFAYIVSEGGSGIQVVDLSNIDNGVVTLSGTVNDVGSSATHNVAIDEASGFLYRCGGGGNGLRIYSLANPALPTFVGSWNERYVHDVQVKTIPHPVTQELRQIAFSCSGSNPARLDIVDVTDKINPVVLSSTPYPGGVYSHQGWLSTDNQYFYLGDELDETGSQETETFVFDVSDWSAPSVITVFTSGNPSINHNMYTLGNRIYQANYRSGMRILDDSDPMNITEVAYFDTVPEDDNASMNGLWSVYPYFPSGIVIGSDFQKGLFVWSVQQAPFGFAYPLGVPDLISPVGGLLTVEIVVDPAFTLDSASPTLWVSSGTGFTAIPLQVNPSGFYEAEFPVLECGSEIQWYVSAQTLTGESQLDPPGAPSGFYTGLVGEGQTLLVEDTMETNSGWTIGLPSDTATTGVWELGDPNGTTAQPEDDQTPGGTSCWFTGQTPPGGGVGDNDIDGGATTLLSPVYDLSTGVDPILRYYQWFSNDAGASPGTDVFRVEISSDGGTSWVLLEETGPSGPGTGGGWTLREFVLSSVIPLTSSVQLKFIANDQGAPSVVEAAIDDLQIADIECTDCNGNGVSDAIDIASGFSNDANSDGIPDECQCTAFIRGEVNQDGLVDLSDAISLLLHLFDGAAEPDPVDRGDVNSSGAIDISDVVYLVEYLFQSGPPPGFPFPDPDCL
ncbi:MAG: hypothetical protein CBC13_02430 [Planctomycetia bacterium TMED53]|nr:MAG: hypothetical protein CBC13_02430 [Planctomycetia bacterium TMED53]